MKKHGLFAAVLLAMLTAGCTTIYHPQTVDIPLINHQGDLRVDASAGLSGIVWPDVLTLGATASYGFTDWLAGQAHFNYGGNNIYGQLAPGAYLRLGEKGLLEGYVGLGMGGAWRDEKSKARDTDTSLFGRYDYSGSFLLPFVQGNIGWHDLANGHIDLAVGLKTGLYQPSFNFSQFDKSGNLIPDQSYRYGDANFLVEPQFEFRAGGEHVKYCLRLSFTWLSDVANGGGGRFTYDFFTISNGITFAF